MDLVITNINFRRNQPAFSLLITNVVYLIRETSSITLGMLLQHPFIRYLIRPIFADFLRRIPGIVVLFYRSPLSMVARERMPNKNISYVVLWEEQIKVSRKFSTRFLNRCFYYLKDGVSLFS